MTDHTFGIGRPAVDLHVAPREQARRTAVTRRGIPDGRVRVLPLPVTSSADGAVRAQTRPRSASPRTTSSCSPWPRPTSSRAPAPRRLLDLVEPVLHDPQARLIAAGPSQEGRWAHAHARTGGRVAALGVVESAGLVAAADVVLESYPCGGGTFALEAASAGLPLLGFAPDPTRPRCSARGPCRAADGRIAEPQA